MAKQWYLYQDNQRIGPLSWEELYQRAVFQSLKGDDLVWHQEMTEWTRVDTVPGLLPGDPLPPPPMDQDAPGSRQQDTLSQPAASGEGSPLPPRGRYTKEPSRSYALPQPGASNREEKGGRGCLIFIISITVLLAALLLIALYFLT